MLLTPVLFVWGKIRRRWRFSYDYSSQRFLVVDNRPRINVVLNWFEDLKQRVPTGR